MILNSKLYRFYIGIVIVAFITLSLWPLISNNINGIKKEIKELKNINVISSVNKYITDKPDYYFKYDGAVYCISIQELVDKKYIEDTKDIDKTQIIQATVHNNKYQLDINQECEEK